VDNLIGFQWARGFDFVLKYNFQTKSDVGCDRGSVGKQPQRGWLLIVFENNFDFAIKQKSK
jgi:hypothetical protein